MKHYQSLRSPFLLLLVLFGTAISAHAAPGAGKHLPDTLPASTPVLLKDTTASLGTTAPGDETEAQFPGGQEAWRQFLSSELDPELPVRKGAPVGEYLTTAQFKVDKEGKVTAIKALTHHGYGMEEELVRVLEKAPTWIPATRSGIAVTAYRKQSVTFFVEEVKGRSKKAKRRP